MKAVFFAAVLLGCQRVALSSPPDDRSGEPSGPQTGLPVGEVVIVSRAGSTPLTVEVAADDHSREVGLMFRRQVPSGSGMLFAFPASSVHSFWMKNTLVPLDMIFVGADLRIAGIVENAAPLTLISRRVAAPSQYVLEVAGGTAFAHGWQTGDRLELHGIPPAR
ncbi:MAG TPA: DUF192 domain-containing protein [Myxococcales bacterium]|nr:DUF192 domain-containing protein [Myxococcales bacterium]